MKRRNFIIQSSVLAGSYSFRKLLHDHDNINEGNDLYSLFKNPTDQYRPFARWWWNGDRIEKEELTRELRLLKDKGIGGVEINPVKFPLRTNNLGKHAVEWLSDEWIGLLNFAINEAKKLNLTCDLIVGSGWPFGAEWLADHERAQVMVIGVKKLEGPLDYEISTFDLLKTADPAISSPFPGRKPELLSVLLTPPVINSIDGVIDLSSQIKEGTIRFNVPDGKFALYALVKINGFVQVIQGAPGATGPVIDHYNASVVKKYLDRMSDTIQQKIGPMSTKIRAMFTDSLELEGANWCDDMQEEFLKRRGYDLMPYLPYLLLKLESLGNSWNYDYTAEHGKEFKEVTGRVRYDFELTKAELLKERFLDIYIQWCKDNKVASRIQAYGRGLLPLEGSFDADIPECETWIRTAGLGYEMSENDYRIGRAYTMANKYVSSAAHLKNKKLISCEELTNIACVFNETLEVMKVAGDQSIISGVTHPIFHGYNYSPPNTDFPGWVQYGTFINERNPWWPWFKLFTDYKARLSAVLQNSTQFAEIALLPALADTWRLYSAQNEPFPVEMHPKWQTLVWEAIHQNGNACDYVSEQVIRDAMIRDGYLLYGTRRYHSLFLPQVETMEPKTAKKLFEFVEAGGKIFFIENYPSKACGWKDHEQRDKEVNEWIQRIKNYPDRAILLDNPGKDHTAWFKDVQERYKIIPYVKIDKPGKFVTQVRYQSKNTEQLILINSNLNASYELTITLSIEITKGKYAWLWDAETGERYRLPEGPIQVELQPADLKLIVFDQNKKGAAYQPIIKQGQPFLTIESGWNVTGKHIDGRVVTDKLEALKDLKEQEGWTDFCGTISYVSDVMVNNNDQQHWLDAGKTTGVTELFVNGVPAGTRWYGRRVFPVKGLFTKGNNKIEIRVTTTMGNYMKSLKDNKVAQYWTNEGNKIQSLQTMGLTGPVIIF